MIFPCTGCQNYWDGWRDRQEPYRQWNQGISLARNIESRRAKAREHYELGRRQQQMLLDSCRAKGCIKPAEQQEEAA